jgi:hypothetical protein
MNTPKAAVLVPTHDHPHTLDLAVRSALEQTVAAIEVIVIGDGVGDDTREVVEALRNEDPRVHFLDLPKGPNHGEVYRGQAIEATEAPAVCYLCDDDLLLPGHVEAICELLAEVDLANSQNGHVEADGSWHHYFGDLGSPAAREWMRGPGRNFVSLTGTAHTAAAYRRLPHGWRTTPPGEWPDHYMWRQFLAEPWLRAATATGVTALQFPSHLEREDWDPPRRRAELERWRNQLATNSGRAAFEREVATAVTAQSNEVWLSREELGEAFTRSKETIDELAAANEIHLTKLGEIEATRTWRLRNRLRGS